MDYCQNCGRSASTKYVEFYQNIGVVIVRLTKSIKGHLCKDCIDKHFWQYTAITLFLGWWGIISFFTTPFILLNNIIRYLGTLGMESQAPQPRLAYLPYTTSGTQTHDLNSLTQKWSKASLPNDLPNRCRKATSRLEEYLLDLIAELRDGGAISYSERMSLSNEAGQRTARLSTESVTVGLELGEEQRRVSASIEKPDDVIEKSKELLLLAGIQVESFVEQVAYIGVMTGIFKEGGEKEIAKSARNLIFYSAAKCYEIGVELSNMAHQ
jgi:hypothetical protein